MKNDNGLDFLHLIFVYGLLRRNSRHEMSAYLHQRASFVGTGYFYGDLFMVDNYPGAIEISGTGKVHGDIYGFDTDQLWIALDAFEEIGVSDEYARQQVEVMTSGGSLVCWCYLYQRPTDKLSIISSGDFLSYLNLQTQ